LRVEDLPPRAVPAAVSDRAERADHHGPHVVEDVRPDLRDRGTELLRLRGTGNADVAAVVQPERPGRGRGQRDHPAAPRRAGRRALPRLHQPNREGGPMMSTATVDTVEKIVPRKKKVGGKKLALTGTQYLLLVFFAA